MKGKGKGGGTFHAIIAVALPTLNDPTPSSPAAMCCSGHWVLAFADADRAASAAQLVEEAEHKMRAVYCQLLNPLLHPSGSGGGEGGKGAMLLPPLPPAAAGSADLPG